MVYERYQFNLCQQNADEPVDGFVNRLRKKASTCQFGSLIEEMIRDQLVIGINDHSTKLCLLKEENLDLNKALVMCRSNEIASQQLKSMKLEEKKTEEVRVVKDRQQKKSKPRNARNLPTKSRNSASWDPNKNADQRRKSFRWSHCGNKERHSLENCPAFGHERKACKRPNHFASVCRSSSRSQVKQLAELTNGEPETDSDEFFFKIEEVSSVQAKGKQLFVSLEFSDANARYKMKMECQLDTGATCNVLTHRDLSIISQNGNPTLQSSKV